MKSKCYHYTADQTQNDIYVHFDQSVMNSINHTSDSDGNSSGCITVLIPAVANQLLYMQLYTHALSVEMNDHCTV